MDRNTPALTSPGDGLEALWTRSRESGRAALAKRARSLAFTSSTPAGVPAPGAPALHPRDAVNPYPAA